MQGALMEVDSPRVFTVHSLWGGRGEGWVGVSSVFGEFHAEVPKTEARWGSNGLLSSIFGE